MKAVIETGGKQYYVQEGSIIQVEKIDAKEGSTVTLDKVLMANGVSGRPFLSSVVVKAKVLKQGKGKKVKVYKYVQKNNYHKTQGHRQPYTRLEILSIENK